MRIQNMGELLNESISAQLPWLPVGDCLQESVRFLVSDDGLRFWIPFKRPADRLGNDAKVARCDGAVPYLCWSDAGFTRSDAFNKITYVIIGYISFDLASIKGFAKKFRIGGFHGFSGYMHPAVLADPLDSDRVLIGYG